MESIAEFRGSSSLYSADTGGMAGGQVSMVSKSGGNDFHGSFYEYLRNNYFDARYFGSTSQSPFKLNNFGVSSGGPILRNKLFYFANYEAVRDRDYIHVTDLAEAHLLALAALNSGPENDSGPGNQPPLIYNLGNGQGFSVRDVIESARRVTGHPIPAEIHPRRPGDPAVLVAGSAKAIRELGWKPRYTALDEIVRTAWIWHQKRYRA